MAWKPYHQFMLKQWDGNAIDLNAVGALKCALLTSLYVPAQATDALFSAISANEVSGSNYTAGGEVLANTTVNLAAGVITFDADDVTWLQHATGFTNARIAVIYETATSKLVCYGDFGADKGNVTGDFTIQMDAAGILDKSEV